MSPLLERYAIDGTMDVIPPAIEQAASSTRTALDIWM